MNVKMKNVRKRSSAEKLREKLICHPNFFVLFSNNMFFHDEAKITRNRKEPTTPGCIPLIFTKLERKAFMKYCSFPNQQKTKINQSDVNAKQKATNQNQINVSQNNLSS